MAKKIVVFLAVSMVTWTVTSSLVAQYSKRRLNQAEGNAPEIVAANNKPKIHRRTATSKVNNIIQNDVSNALAGIARMRLKSHDISIIDGIAVVNAHVSMIDKRSGMQFIWRLRVVDPNELPLAGMVYDQQIFSVDEQGRKEVDFSDTVQIPAGARRIELVLFEKTQNSDLSFLDDSKTADSHEVIRIAKVITKK